MGQKLMTSSPCTGLGGARSEEQARSTAGTHQLNSAPAQHLLSKQLSNGCAHVLPSSSGVGGGSVPGHSHSSVETHLRVGSIGIGRH